MADLGPSSPLSHMRRGGAAAVFGGQDLTMREEIDLRVVHLFDRPDDPEFRLRVAKVAGNDLPLTPNTVAGSVAWIAPGQWLIVGRDFESGDGIDVSDAHCAIGLRGARVVDLLSQGVPIDLDAKAFAPGRCARTLMGSIPIFLMTRDNSEYLILVERGLAHAAWAWLVDGASSLNR